MIGELLSFCIVGSSVWGPNLQIQYYTDEYSLIGIEGPTNWTTNSLGIRGRELSDSPESEYRILTVGSSTTECVYLDDSKEWPHKIEEFLGNTSDGRRVWVGNIGKSGCTTRENIQHLLNVPDKVDADMVIVLPGSMDGKYMESSKQVDVYSSKSDEDLMNLLQENQNRDAFLGAHVGDFFHPKRTSVAYFCNYYLKYLVCELFGFGERNKVNSDDYAKKKWLAYINSMNESKINLDNISQVDILEENDVTEFSRNLNKMVDISEEKNFRLVFVTQPFSDESLLMLNQEVQNVSANRNVECITVGEMIPANYSVYYDKGHFNENGANLMAIHITDYLKNTEPFS